MLESGYVILQYRDLPPPQLAQLAGLADPLVTVAPAVGPLPARVVATAWSWKQECGSVDGGGLDALRAFVTAHKGAGFAHT